MAPGPTPRPPAERLLLYLDVGARDACWPFTGMRDRWGYGRLNVAGVPRPAHRVAYEAEYGPVPPGLWVLHRCDNPACCNPRHLYAGTHADNMRDMRERGRGAGGAGGERNGRAKLSASQVAEVRQAYAAGETQRDIATRFGITQAAVSSIVTGRTRRSG